MKEVSAFKKKITFNPQKRGGVGGAPDSRTFTFKWPLNSWTSTNVLTTSAALWPTNQLINTCEEEEIKWALSIYIYISIYLYISSDMFCNFLFLVCKANHIVFKQKESLPPESSFVYLRPFSRVWREFNLSVYSSSLLWKAASSWFQLSWFLLNTDWFGAS